MRLPVSDQLERGLQGVRPVVALLVCEKRKMQCVNLDI